MLKSIFSVVRSSTNRDSSARSNQKAVEAGLGLSCLARLAVQRKLEHGWPVEIATGLNLQRTLTLLPRENEHRSHLPKACFAILQPGFK